MISWQDCNKYRPDGPCASDEEKEEFFHHLDITIEGAENFIAFNEVETQKAIQKSAEFLLKANTKAGPYKNSKGIVELT